MLLLQCIQILIKGVSTGFTWCILTNLAGASFFLFQRNICRGKVLYMCFNNTSSVSNIIGSLFIQCLFFSVN